MLKKRATNGEQTFCCHFARRQDCRRAENCPWGHRDNAEVVGIRNGGTAIKCENEWFDGACYHQRLFEHP